MDIEKRDLIAQWAFDTRPVLSRFHLWLDDIEVEVEHGSPANIFGFLPRGIGRSLALTSAVTALGTKLFGRFGEGAGANAHEYNQVKKAADAISAYVTSEGLWHLTRHLPENHAIMVSLGEGLMPKAGETPEMGANPLLGFGRVYARPEVARFVDGLVHRLLNDRTATWDYFYGALADRGITVWGAAVDTLENTSRFAAGDDTGPMSVFHLFDQPLTVTRPYEAYAGSLAIPRAVRATAETRSILLDFLTPRQTLLEAIELAYPGIERRHIHVWTLRGASREHRLGRLWSEWRELKVHLVEEGWVLPTTSLPVFTESGTYAPIFRVGAWTDEAGAQHVFLCDGYAATAEAMQAASLSEALDIDVSMALYSSRFKLPHHEEYRAMQLDPDAGDFGERLASLFSSAPDEALTASYAEAIRDAARCGVPVGRRILRADDFFPEKRWRVFASLGHMCPDPYTGAPGVTRVHDQLYRVTTRQVTHGNNTKITFTLRLRDDLETSRLVFSPLLDRLLVSKDFRDRPVRVSDSGRIRNELQTMVSQGLTYEGTSICVHFDRIDDKVVPAERQDRLRQVLQWYKQHHPVWFSWLQIRG